MSAFGRQAAVATGAERMADYYACSPKSCLYGSSLIGPLRRVSTNVRFGEDRLLPRTSDIGRKAAIADRAE